jgi:hypothetical protein
MLINGSCHCGNISFRLDWLPQPSEIPARACSCSFCRKHGGVWTSCPAGALDVRVRDPGQVSEYSFGTRTAAFHVCTKCGAVPVVTSKIDGNTYAVVNVNALEGIDPGIVKESRISFDGESEAARLARRKKGWIADVRFCVGDA